MHLPTAAHHLWTQSRSHIQTSTSFNTSCTGLASVAVVISWHVGSGRRGHGARGTLAITATALWIERTCTFSHLFIPLSFLWDHMYTCTDNLVFDLARDLAVIH